MALNPEGALANLPPDVRETLRSYLKEVTALFGPLLEAVILYGSAATGEYLPGRSNLNLLLLLSKYELITLQRYAKAHRRWSREQLTVPLMLTEAELRSSSHLFPLEYGEIGERHILLSGRDPFPTLSIDRQHLRIQCEQEIRGNLVRLRQRFVEGGGTAEAAAILLPLSVTALLPCVRGLFRLRDLPVPGTADAVLNELQARMDVDPEAFQSALALKRGLVSLGPLEVPRLFERYASALERLIERMEHLNTEGL